MIPDPPPRQTRAEITAKSSRMKQLLVLLGLLKMSCSTIILSELQRSGCSVTFQCTTDRGRDTLWRFGTSEPSRVDSSVYTEDREFIKDTVTFSVNESTNITCIGLDGFDGTREEDTLMIESSEGCGITPSPYLTPSAILSPSTSLYPTPSTSLYPTPSTSLYPTPSTSLYPTPSTSPCGTGCITGAIIGAVLSAFGLVAVAVLCAYSRRKKTGEKQARPNADTQLLPQYTFAESPRHLPTYVQHSPPKEELKKDSPAESDPILNGATSPPAELTSPKLPLHIQQQPQREEKETYKDIDSGDLSQDPNPPSTRASPKLPPRVQHTPMEEDDSVDSAENDDISHDPTPPSTRASPKLPPHVQHTPMEEDDSVDSEENLSADNGMIDTAPSPPPPLPVTESSPVPVSASSKQLEEYMEAYRKDLKEPFHGYRADNPSQVIGEEDGDQLLDSSSEFVTRKYAGRRTQRHQFTERSEGVNVLTSQESGKASDPYLFPSLAEKQLPIGPRLSSPEPKVATQDLPVSTSGIQVSSMSGNEGLVL